MANYLVLLTTAPDFRGPAFMEHMKAVCGEEPRAAWASDTTFGFFVAAEMSARLLNANVLHIKAGIRALTIIEVGPDWSATDSESRAAGWLQSHLGSPRGF